MRAQRTWQRTAFAAALAIGLCGSFPALVSAASPSPSLNQDATSLAIGSSGAAVKILEQTLVDMGFPTPLDGTLSPTVAATVGRAAAALGVHYTDLQTQLAVIGFGPRAMPLYAGASGPEVQALQQALTRAGYGVAASGVFGPQTSQEAALFQKDHPAAATGITLWAVEVADASDQSESAPQPSGSAEGQAIADAAEALVGHAYSWGATGPNAFDCSGLVFYVLGQLGDATPARSSYDQWAEGAPVASDALAPGDLVFFDTDGGGASHVGIYLGGVDRDFVHAANPEAGVRIDSLFSAYWAAHFIGARRLS